MIVGDEKITEGAERILHNIGEDAEDDLAAITEVFIIAHVNYAQTEDEETGSVFYHCSSARGYVQRGLLEDARRAIDSNVRHPDDD